jgi:hypothetical protein
MTDLELGVAERITTELLNTILRAPVELIQKRMNGKNASEVGDMGAAEETA